MSAPLRILYVGTLAAGGTCLQRMRTLIGLGHEVTSLDTVPGPLAARRLTLWWRVQHRLLGDRDESRANERLRRISPALAPDVVWIDKGLTIERATLLALQAQWPKACFVAYSGDDMFNPRNQSQAWRECLPLMDTHVTTKSFNVPELYAAGARDVLFVDKAYSPQVHRPLPVSDEDRERFGGAVGFIGWPERARERSMRFLARAGVPVRVWGPWPRWKAARDFRVEGRPLWNDDYARAIAAFDINLCFLRKVNRDRHTTRSVEIPACGGFMLGERTEEHQRLFAEGVEADYFGSDEELLAKVRHHLANPEARQRIAAAGHARCLRDGYSYDERLAAILDHCLARRVRAEAS